MLAEHQAALRRVATLVARGVPPAELFSAVAEELARCLGRITTRFCFATKPDGGGILLAAGHGDADLTRTSGRRTVFTRRRKRRRDGVSHRPRSPDGDIRKCSRFHRRTFS